jgi:hypothetical protein
MPQAETSPFLPSLAAGLPWVACLRSPAQAQVSCRDRALRQAIRFLAQGW